MASQFILAYLLCLVFVSNVSGQICGTAANQVCNSTQIFSSFEISYMVESTSSTSQAICSYLLRLSPEIVDGKANFSLQTRPENGTQLTSVTEEIAVTEDPDRVTLVFSNDPDTSYEVDLPYANYSACFVTRFNAPIGCRLWVYEGTSAETVEACKEGHAQVCGETVYSTYNEILCASGPTGSA